MSFATGLMIPQLLGSVFGGSQNPASTLLQQNQPAIQAQQQMQQQNIDTTYQSYVDQAKAQLNDAAAAAQKSARESAGQISDQALAYDSSGVQLSGTPMLVLAASRNLADQDVAATLARGQAAANLTLTQGAVTANQGRAQLLGQSVQNVSNIASAQIGGTDTQLKSILGALNSLGLTSKSAIGSNAASPISIPAPGDPLQTINPPLTSLPTYPTT